MDRISLLGIKIDRATTAEALDIVAERVRSRRAMHIVTADASMVVMAHRDPELMAIVNGAELTTPDGSGIVWACRMLGRPVSERVSGVDLVAQLCRLSADPKYGYRIYFLGAAPGIAERAADNLRSKYPGATIVGARDGYFGAEREGEIVAEIAALNPDIVLVAFGIPKQEKFILRYRTQIGASVYIGVGGSFDVYSGLVRRAPVWMQKAGFEWVYRLCQNPKKIGKVMTLPQFAFMALRARLTGSG